MHSNSATRELGLTEKAVEEFSFCRLIDALASPGDVEAHRAAGHELAVCSETAKLVPPSGDRGYRIPADVTRARPKHRGMLAGTIAAGGAMVGTQLVGGSFIEMLRSRMVLERLGVRHMDGLTGDVTIPRQTSGGTAHWIGEAGAVTESTPGTDQVNLKFRSVAIGIDVSRRLLRQGSPDVEQFIRADVAAGLGLELERAALFGAGGLNTPLGIASTTGVGSVEGGTNGASITYSHVVGLESAVSAANADVGKLAFVTNAKVRGKLRQQFINTNCAVPVWTDVPTVAGEFAAGRGILAGYSAWVTGTVPSNLTKAGSGAVCSAVVFGNWDDLIIATWGGLEIVVDPYTNIRSGVVRFTAFLDCDVAVRRAASFAVMLDALTT